jgi:hypothetical protein
MVRMAKIWIYCVELGLLMESSIQRCSGIVRHIPGHDRITDQPNMLPMYLDQLRPTFAPVTPIRFMYDQPFNQR